jgi:hypothetical protein
MGLGRAIACDCLTVLADASGGRVTLGELDTPRLGTISCANLVICCAGRVVRAAHGDRAWLAHAGALTLPALPAVDGLTAHGCRDGSFTRRRATEAAAIRIREFALRDARIGVVLADASTPQRFVPAPWPRTAR